MSENLVGIGTRVINAMPGATATGAGNSIDLDHGRRTFTMQTVVTGTPVAVSITLQGSLDGANWTTLATSTSVTGDQQYVIDKPQRFLRANLGTLTGGTSPTVTAYIVAGN